MTAAHFTLTARSRPHVLRAVQEAPDLSRVTLAPPRRTAPQNARMWAMLTSVSRKVEWDGRFLSPEDWKDLFTAALRRQRAVPGLEGGVVFLGARTSEMSKEELGELMDFIEAFAAERGVGD